MMINLFKSPWIILYIITTKGPTIRKPLQRKTTTVESFTMLACNIVELDKGSTDKATM